MTQQQEMVACGNCGHAEPMTTELAELSFAWLDESTCKTSCPACKSSVIMRTWAVNENGYPVGGEMLVVKTSLYSKGETKP
jgi:Zn ribbon nucleic-acid-binding protein